MKAGELPETFFALAEMTSDGCYRFSGDTDVDDIAYTCAWPSEEAMLSWFTTSDDEMRHGPVVDRAKFILSLLLSPQIEFLLYDLGANEFNRDTFRIKDLPKDRTVALHDLRHDLRSVWEGIAPLFGSMNDEMVSLLMEISDEHPELKSWEAAQYFTELVEEGAALITDGREKSAHIEKDLGRVVNALLHVACPVLVRCPAPDECSRCGEGSWSLVSESPSGKAATWKCDYCGKTEIVRSDQLASEGTDPNRSSIPRAVQREVWRRDGGKCVECGSQENLEYDHIIPVSKGGANTVRNIQLLCERCNRSKGNSI